MWSLGRPGRIRWLLGLTLALLVGSRPEAATEGFLYDPSIHCIQDPSDPCQAAMGDTVYHVCAFVTGLDRTPPSFGLYFQNRANGTNGAPYTGIGVNTGNVDVAQSLGLALGDSIIVDNGKIGEIGLERQIVPPGTPILVTKVLSSRVTPKAHLGTVNELRMALNSTGTTWRGCLVRVNTQMRVARTSSTGGLQPNRFIVVDEGPCPPGSPGPCDSMMVDGYTLRSPSYPPPPVGRKVYLVQGVFGQSGSAYEIRLRDSSDTKVQGDLGVADAAWTGLSLILISNPSRAIQLRFSVPRPDPVDLAVFDLAGRRVATLASGALAPGTYQREWIPRRQGGLAGAGVYFVRLAMGTERRVARAVILD